MYEGRPCFICGNEKSPKAKDPFFVMCKSRRKCYRRWKKTKSFDWITKYIIRR